MIGGYQILDLRSIDLQKSGSASSINDPYVLKQLLMFRDHIDKAYNFSKPLVNQLKPVLIRFRDKKSGEKTEGATFGELSVDGNYYTFKVTARISGALVLRISVAFEEITNDYGNKEWVIDTATIQLKDESKTISGDLELTGDLSVGDDATITGDASVGGILTVTDDLSVGDDATITGDASVGGDLSVVGDINGSDIDMSGKIEGAEIVEKMSGYSFFQQPDPESLTKDFVYAGVAKNGNKITFVCACTFTRTDTCSTQILGEFRIPESILAKLYPAQVGSDNFLDNKVITAWKSDNTKIDMTAYIIKLINGIRITFNSSGINAMDLNTPYYLRYEVTFLLSDNLISQE